MKKILFAAVIAFTALSSLSFSNSDYPGDGPPDINHCLHQYYSILNDGQPNAEYRANLVFQACMQGVGIPQIPSPPM